MVAQRDSEYLTLIQNDENDAVRCSAVQSRLRKARGARWHVHGGDQCFFSNIADFSATRKPILTHPVIIRCLANKPRLQHKLSYPPREMISLAGFDDKFTPDYFLPNVEAVSTIRLYSRNPKYELASLLS
jgi:hypothetical protein